MVNVIVSGAISSIMKIMVIDVRPLISVIADCAYTCNMSYRKLTSTSSGTILSATGYVIAHSLFNSASEISTLA